MLISRASSIFPPRGSKDGDREVSEPWCSQSKQLIVVTSFGGRVSKPGEKMSGPEGMSDRTPLLNLHLNADVNNNSIDEIPPAPNHNLAVTPPIATLPPVPQRRNSHWDLLPPQEEVIQGCRILGTSYFQLGELLVSIIGS